MSSAETERHRAASQDRLEQLTELSLLVQHGENVEAVACAEKLLDDDCPVDEIIEALSRGLAVLRDKCTIENFQLLDVLLASRAMVEVVDECVARKLKEGMDQMAGLFPAAGDGSRTLVIGAIQGDVHDLGKHIVATLCRFSGIRVVDLGKDVPVETFVDTAIEEHADFIGVSSLMTVCLGRVREIRAELEKRGHGHIQVVGGGAAVQQSSEKILNLDYVAHDAFDGLDYFSKPVNA